MTLETADRLLTLAGLDDGPVADRLAVLFGERGVVDELDPSERCAAELARLAAAGHLSADPTVAALIVDQVAAALDVDVSSTSTRARLAEDLHEGLRAAVDDLDARIAALSFPDRQWLRRWIDGRRRAAAVRTPSPATAPVRSLHLLAAEVARLEDSSSGSGDGSAEGSSPSPGEAA